MILQVYIPVNHQNQQKQSKNIAIYPQKFLIRLTFLLWLGKMKVFYLDFTFEKLKELYMKKLSLPPTERRRLTRNQIYQYIYKAPGCSKQEIADSLNFSMPTVHQNLNELTQAGLVRIDGVGESTGGRRPLQLTINENAHFSVGISVTDDHFRIIAANLRDIRGELDVKPYVLKTADDGLKLLFVGVITDYVNIWESPEHLEGLEITDSVTAAARALEEGRKLSPDFTICIYHGGFGDEDGPVKENRGSELAALGFDVLLTAHQHAIIEPKHIGSTLTLQTGSKAVHAAHLIFSRGGMIDAELIEADASRPLLPSMEDFPMDTEEKVIGSLSEPVGRIDGRLEDISKLSSAIRGSSLADFFNDVQLAFTGADVSAVSLFNDPVSIGPAVTLGDLLAAYPFANTLLKVDMK